MKRIGRVVGFIGGAAAVVWAMRDRLISIAAPAEPQPPRFRVVKPSPTPTPGPMHVTDDLTLITGVGPVFAARLRAAGLDSFELIAGSDDATLAEVTGVVESRVERWRQQASTL
jgi:predicted flap endonuclease-1-like 5' DNA nuclease